MKIFSRIPLLLYSYLATEMLAPFFASFLVMNAVFFLVKLIPFLNFVLNLGVDFPDFIRLLCYLFPNIFLYTLPMSSMLGITICFSRLSSDMELLALKAGGISIYRILPPVIMVSSMITLLTFAFSLHLIPASERSMKKLSYQIIKEKIDRGIQAHHFSDALGDIVIHVEDIDNDTGTWKNVWISDMRSKKIPTITMAQTGEMKTNSQEMAINITLYQGSMHIPKEGGGDIVKFSSYQLDIPLKSPNTPLDMVHKRLLDMPELLAQAKKLGGESTQAGRVYLIEFHKRLMLPIGCLMLSFLALPLGLQAKRGKKAVGIPVGLAIFITYYILYTLGKELAESGVINLIVALWTPNALFFLLALFWIQRAKNEKGLVPEKLLIPFKAITKLLPKKTMR